MTPLFKKLNLAETRSIHILNAPESFEPELQSLAGVQVSRQARGKIVFAMAFVKTRQEVEAGYEPVRQVAIDEDWSALRFRKVEFIKTMNRKPEGAISSAGRKKAREQKPGEA